MDTFRSTDEKEREKAPFFLNKSKTKNFRMWKSGKKWLYAGTTFLLVAEPIINAGFALADSTTKGASATTASSAAASSVKVADSIYSVASSDAAAITSDNATLTSIASAVDAVISLAASTANNTTTESTASDWVANQSTASSLASFAGELLSASNLLLTPAESTRLSSLGTPLASNESLSWEEATKPYLSDVATYNSYLSDATSGKSNASYLKSHTSLDSNYASSFASSFTAASSVLADILVTASQNANNGKLGLAYTSTSVSTSANSDRTINSTGTSSTGSANKSSTFSASSITADDTSSNTSSSSLLANSAIAVPQPPTSLSSVSPGSAAVVPPMSASTNYTSLDSATSLSASSTAPIRVMRAMLATAATTDTTDTPNSSSVSLADSIYSQASLYASSVTADNSNLASVASAENALISLAVSYANNTKTESTAADWAANSTAASSVASLAAELLSGSLVSLTASDTSLLSSLGTPLSASWSLSWSSAAANYTSDADAYNSYLSAATSGSSNASYLSSYTSLSSAASDTYGTSFASSLASAGATIAAASSVASNNFQMWTDYQVASTAYIAYSSAVAWQNSAESSIASIASSASSYFAAISSENAWLSSVASSLGSGNASSASSYFNAMNCASTPNATISAKLSAQDATIYASFYTDRNTELVGLSAYRSSFAVAPGSTMSPYASDLATLSNAIVAVGKTEAAYSEAALSYAVAAGNPATTTNSNNPVISGSSMAVGNYVYNSAGSLVSSGTLTAFSTASSDASSYYLAMENMQLDSVVGEYNEYLQASSAANMFTSAAISLASNIQLEYTAVSQAVHTFNEDFQAALTEANNGDVANLRTFLTGLASQYSSLTAQVSSFASDTANSYASYTNAITSYNAAIAPYNSLVADSPQTGTVTIGGVTYPAAQFTTILLVPQTTTGNTGDYTVDGDGNDFDASYTTAVDSVMQNFQTWSQKLLGVLMNGTPSGNYGDILTQFVTLWKTNFIDANNDGWNGTDSSLPTLNYDGTISGELTDAALEQMGAGGNNAQLGVTVNPKNVSWNFDIAPITISANFAPDLYEQVNDVIAPTYGHVTTTTVGSAEDASVEQIITPVIDIEKASGTTPDAGEGNNTDSDNNMGNTDKIQDADTEDTAVTIPYAAKTSLFFRITNEGNEALQNVQVNDEKLIGSPDIDEITWTYKGEILSRDANGNFTHADGSLLVLGVGETITGEGTLGKLPAWGGYTEDKATVTGIGVSDQTSVSDSDTWWGKENQLINTLPFTGSKDSIGLILSLVCVLSSLVTFSVYSGRYIAQLPLKEEDKK